MRLIDADALHERVRETTEAGLIFSGMTIAEFIHALVDEQPTLELGVDICGENRCPFCGARGFLLTVQGAEHFSTGEQTCPHCGAKMEEQEV